MKTANIISMHPGKQHNFEQAEQLIKYFPSYRHVTGFAIAKNTLSKLKFLPRYILNEMHKRSVSEEVANHTDVFPWYEFLYKLRYMTHKSLPYGNFFLKRNTFFQKRFLRNYTPPRIFIGFDNSSALIFKRWKGKSILILDLTIAIPQYKKKLAQEYNLKTLTLDNLTRLDDVWYDTYKTELQLADYILCGSEFVKNSCLYFGIEENKLVVISYGANLEKFTPNILPEKRKEEPFKIAFVGNISYRKGADVLLRAWEKFIEKYANCELHFYGNIQIDLGEFVLQKVFFHGFIAQDELIKHLSESHVSILPTFFEGSSYAIYQSMALGLAVVTTKNCGSIIKNMENGIIVDYGCDVQIFNALTILKEQRDLRLELSNKAMLDVKEYGWDSYGIKLQKFISTL
jgi:glycosyltransferase involved in cell wall biosynthesis